MTSTFDEPLTGNYFVSNYPPFSAWTESQVPAFRTFLKRASNPGEELGLYVHIPFCADRCQYCYYLAYDDRPRSMQPYVDALVCELSRYSACSVLEGRTPSFIYFGGGTPSLLPMPLLKRMFDGLKKWFSWSNAREVTFECAPKSVLREKLSLLRDAGVTRVSLGAQQLNDTVLRLNGRVHLTADVERAYEWIRRAHFGVVNVDLIVGMVGETDETFQMSLERVIQLAPDSVTVYQLEIPHNTPLYRTLREEKVGAPLAGWSEKRSRLALGFQRLESHGYTLRSAYTAVRDPERHPFVYQDRQYYGADLLGIGVSAFSYIAGWNQQNLASMESYYAAVSRGEQPFGRAYALSVEERMVREFVLQLKLGAIDCDYFRRKFRVDLLEYFGESLAALVSSSLASIEDGQIRLTRKGLLRVDHLLAGFYFPQHRALRYS